jgi:hypothetical protein
VWPSHSQISPSPLSTASLDLGKTRSRRETKLGCRGLTDLGDVMLCSPPPPQKKSLHECCGMGRRIIVMKLICSLGHCKYDGHTIHKLSRWRLTADCLAPQDNDCSRMNSEVSSDWLPSYIMATGPVLEIFKMAGYFPDSPRTVRYCVFPNFAVPDFHLPVPGFLQSA